MCSYVTLIILTLNKVLEINIEQIEGAAATITKHWKCFIQSFLTVWSNNGAMTIEQITFHPTPFVVYI